MFSNSSTKAEINALQLNAGIICLDDTRFPRQDYPLEINRILTCSWRTWCDNLEKYSSWHRLRYSLSIALWSILGRVVAAGSSRFRRWLLIQGHRPSLSFVQPLFGTSSPLSLSRDPAGIELVINCPRHLDVLSTLAVHTLCVTWLIDN